MRSGCLFFFCFFISVLFINISFAQDSSTAQSSTASAIDFYTKYVGGNSPLYTGSEYMPYNSRTITGHQWFESNLLPPGSVNYDDVSYQKVNLAYDIVKDELTTNRFNENFRIKLVSEKVVSFSLSNHFFVRIVQDSMNNSIIATGFYDRLYNGHLKFYIKRLKKIEEKISESEGDKLWFEEHDQYYVQKNNKFYSVQSKALLFSVLKDRKKDVQKYLRKEKIKFRKNPETTILKALQYYDQLKN